MQASLFPNEHGLGLLTDLYELTMAAGYHTHGMADERATFELWVRKLPESRNYLVAAGLEQAVHYLTHLSFSAEQIDYLRGLPTFERVPAGWFDRLAKFRFDGDLWAIPEGTVVFAGEPLLRVTAPMMAAQIVETYLITTITMQTLVASKAARITTAAQGRAVVDFGSRRAHGPQAGLLAARAAYIGGCSGTSNTEAARILGIPPLGTQAHSWVMAFGNEIEAFRAFGETFPSASTMLIDTFDTLQGARNALAAAAPLQAVRLDSGDLAELSKGVRKILDDGGRHDVQIFASGDLNEFRIRQLLANGSPIDAFGVGTDLVTSRDDPSLNTVYKLVEQDTPEGPIGRFKLSQGKKTYPYAKQVYRKMSDHGLFESDLIARENEKHHGEALLIPILKNGQLLNPLPALATCQARFAQQRRRLPPELQDLEKAAPYPVTVSDHLEKELERLAKARLQN